MKCKISFSSLATDLSIGCIALVMTGAVVALSILIGAFSEGLVERVVTVLLSEETPQNNGNLGSGRALQSHDIWVAMGVFLVFQFVMCLGAVSAVWVCRKWLRDDQRKPAMQVSADIGEMHGVPLVPRAQPRVEIPDFPLTWSRRQFREAWVPFIATAVVLTAYSVVTEVYFPEATQQDIALFKTLLNGIPVWLAVLTLVVGAALSEELLFRGFMLGQLRRTRVGFVGASVIVSGAWTVLHWGYSSIGIINVFLAGLLFSWALWRTGTLWVPILFHALYNAVVLILILTVYS